MKEELKNQLDNLFADAEKRKEKAATKENKEADEQEKFNAAFLEKRNNDIHPAFAGFASYIAEKGWTGDIELIEEKPATFGIGGKVERHAQSYGITITFYRGTSRPSYGISRQLPYFSMYANKRERVVDCIASTIGLTHGGSGGGDGSFKLDEINVDTVQTKLVKYFKKLMNDARPFNER